MLLHAGIEYLTLLIENSNCIWNVDLAGAHLVNINKENSPSGNKIRFQIR